MIMKMIMKVMKRFKSMQMRFMKASIMKLSLVSVRLVIALTLLVQNFVHLNNARLVWIV